MADNITLIKSWNVTNVPDHIVEAIAKEMDKHPEYAFRLNPAAPLGNSYCLLSVHGTIEGKRRPAIDIAAYGNDKGKPCKIGVNINK